MFILSDTKSVIIVFKIPLHVPNLPCIPRNAAVVTSVVALLCLNAPNNSSWGGGVLQAVLSFPEMSKFINDSYPSF